MRRLLALGSVLALAGSATALAETRIYSDTHGGSFPVEPEKVKYSKSLSGAGEPVTLKNLSWRHWGADHAEATGTIKACPTPDSCFTTDAEVTAKRRVRHGDASYYTKLVVFFGQNGIKIGLPTPGG
jgi:predicted secreted Zn-dependent protease